MNTQAERYRTHSMWLENTDQLMWWQISTSTSFSNMTPVAAALHSELHGWSTPLPKDAAFNEYGELRGSVNTARPQAGLHHYLNTGQLLRATTRVTFMPSVTLSMQGGHMPCSTIHFWHRAETQICVKRSFRFLTSMYRHLNCKERSIND